MRKILLIALAAVLVLSLLAACNKKEAAVPVDPVDDGSTQTGANETENKGAAEEEEIDPDSVIDFEDLLAAAEDAQ